MLVPSTLILASGAAVLLAQAQPQTPAAAQPAAQPAAPAPATTAAPAAPAPPAATPPTRPDVVAGIPVNYEEERAAGYTLPDPLVSADGKPVRDAKTWTTKRRPEIIKAFEEQQFGRVPGKPAGLRFDVFDKGTPALNGTAIRK